MTFVAWKYQGRGIDFGRVLYQQSRKWWVRLGPFILSVEVAASSHPRNPRD